MTDSFFDLNSQSGADRTFEEDDDTEYDALNSETFGDSLPGNDWEEHHEQLASELERSNFDEEEVGSRLLTFGRRLIITHEQLAPEEERSNFDDETEMRERIVNYLFNDLGEDLNLNVPSSKIQPSNKQTAAASQGPFKWWMNGIPPSTAEQPNKAPAPMMEPWWQRPQTTHFGAAEAMAMPPKPVKILTVEELEEKMRQEAAAAAAIRPAPGSVPHPEDVDRETQHLPNQMQNGNYGRGRGGMIARGRYRPEVIQEQPYHAVHHPYPPYPGSSSMTRQPMRHPGAMYQRFYDGRMVLQQVGGSGRQERVPPGRHDRGLPGRQGLPRPGNPQYFPNQHPPFGRMGPPPPTDEYAGLMSQQEKHWLASIQMMQLNTNQPFQDDYYYIMFQHRQGNCGRKMCGVPHGQKRDQLPLKPASTYIPLQFESTLGKLQVGSVTAPRKIIDMELVESFDHSTKHSDRKSKQILLEIEELYNYVIQIEDAFNPLNTTKQDIDIIALQEKLLSMVIPEGKLLQIMSIRKGKKLVLRMLPSLLFPSSLLHRLMMDLVPITRKDTENNMLLFLPAIRNYLQNVSLETLVEITNNYDNQFLLSNKFTVSVMANLIERADQVKAECTDESVLNEWNLFLIRLLESTRLWNQTERPVVAVDRNILIRHLTPIMDQVSAAETNTLLVTLQSATHTLASATATTTSSEPPRI